MQTFILTYIITPWTKILLVKLTVSHLVKKFPVFNGSESSLPLLQDLACCPYPVPPPTSWCSILILSFHPRLDLQRGLFPLKFPRQNQVYTSPLSSTCATLPARLNLLDLIARIIFGDDYKSLSFFLLCSFLHSQVTTSFLDTNIFPSDPFKHPQPTFLPKCERPSFTPIEKNRQSYSSVHLNLFILW